EYCSCRMDNVDYLVDGGVLLVQFFLKQLVLKQAVDQVGVFFSQNVLVENIFCQRTAVSSIFFYQFPVTCQVVYQLRQIRRSVGIHIKSAAVFLDQVFDPAGIVDNNQFTGRKCVEKLVGRIGTQDGDIQKG